MYSKNVTTNSGLPLNLARSTGFCVATPTGQVSRWQTRIITQPETTSGAVAKPNSSAPSSAAITTSRPVFSWPSDGRKIPWHSYKSDRTDARASGPAFARAFVKTAEFIRETYRKHAQKKKGKRKSAAEPCQGALHLVAHSMGGAIGLVMSMFLARTGMGLERERREVPTSQQTVSLPVVIKATFPLWGTVLVLLVTRIPQLGIKALLTDSTSFIGVSLGSLAQLDISRSLVLTVDNIYGASSTWQFQTLYIPAVIPFLLISVCAFVIFRLRSTLIRQLFTETYQRMVNPIKALLGALVMVKLLMIDGQQSMVMIVGEFFAKIIGQNWSYFASYLGALGSFFSGSATISNLTFGKGNIFTDQNLLGLLDNRPV